MTRAITTSFRGQSALLVMHEGRDQDSLVFALGRLGIEVNTVAPEHFAPRPTAEYQLMFIDGDDGGEPLWAEPDRPDLSIVALIGSEAPSRLARVIRHRSDSHILKPVRSAGVYSAVVLAVQAQAERRRMTREIDTIRQRLAGRRLVVQAILQHMSKEGSTETDAYQMLREAAMNARVPMEEIARRRLVETSASDSKVRLRKAT